MKTASMLELHDATEKWLCDPLEYAHVDESSNDGAVLPL